MKRKLMKVYENGSFLEVLRKPTRRKLIGKTFQEYGKIHFIMDFILMGMQVVI